MERRLSHIFSSKPQVKSGERNVENIANNVRNALVFKFFHLPDGGNDVKVRSPLTMSGTHDRHCRTIGLHSYVGADGGRPGGNAIRRGQGKKSAALWRKFLVIANRDRSASGEGHRFRLDVSLFLVAIKVFCFYCGFTFVACF